MNDSLIKVRVALPDGEWHGASGEWLWVEMVGPETARIFNIPACASGLAVGDVVRLAKTDDVPAVLEVVSRSGHSTFQVVFNDRFPPADTFRDFWEPLASLGCRYERGDEPAPMIAIDVPAGIDPEVLFTCLAQSEDRFELQFTDAYMHPSES